MLNLCHKITALPTECGIQVNRLHVKCCSIKETYLELVFYTQRMTAKRVALNVIVLDTHIFVKHPSTNERLIERAITYRDKWLKDGFL